jgi:hypothetical protein
MKKGLTVVRPQRRFSLTAYLGMLQKMGCGSFVIKVTFASREEWPQIMDSFNRGREHPGSIGFKFVMGVV